MTTLRIMKLKLIREDGKVIELEIKDGVVAIPKGRYVLPNLEKSLAKKCMCKEKDSGYTWG
jgi:hypothetical protein